MPENLIHLEWEQTDFEVNIKLPQPEIILFFTIDKRLINHLVCNSPKIVTLFVELQHQSEKEYIIDFEGLKPITSGESKLKITVSDKKDIEKTTKNQIIGKYCFARGESHFTRYISENGWQNQRKYFNIHGTSVYKQLFEKQTDMKTEKKQDENIQKKESIQDSTEFYKTLFE